MPQLTFFKQMRQDGGVRTGVELDGEVVLGMYSPAPDDSDPSLVRRCPLRRSLRPVRCSFREAMAS